VNIHQYSHSTVPSSPKLTSTSSCTPSHHITDNRVCHIQRAGPHRGTVNAGSSHHLRLMFDQVACMMQGNQSQTWRYLCNVRHSVAERMTPLGNAELLTVSTPSPQCRPVHLAPVVLQIHQQVAIPFEPAHARPHL
jgi:hypothetical protein